MEAAMAGKVKGRRTETGCFTFGSGSIFVFTLALLSLYCTLWLAGCNNAQMPSAKVDRARNIPAAARKAELLKELERKFENPQVHFELAQLYEAEGLLQKAEYHYNVALS